MSKIIMHIDINQFFAAATVLLEPSLKNKPLIIAGSSRRGIVSTASYEARKYGIHSAMPTYMAKKLCPNVIIRPVNFEWYNQKSHEFFSFIEENYTLEVSSPGADRKLTKEREFLYYIGREVDVKLYKAENGVKEFTGVLKDYKDKTAFVELDGEVKEIPVKQAVYIRLSFKF